ncbi:MAG TPA: NAD-dependent epimerase/dehydratase family protein [Longimicrobiales bacterium]|nr:NAD-dependent epimerase/dehydratase family protein [Longimicrobiales bacterium]
MRVLVTGGTGVVGRAVIAELRGRGHEIRILSRGAADAAEAWDGRVEGWTGDVGDADSVAGAAAGCSAVVHIAGIVDEAPPLATFERINVTGTRNVVAEAERAGVDRVVFISSLGAEHGESGYHASKLEGEALVRGFRGTWTILRTGAVAGPGDETVSVVLRLIRTLPAVPVIDGGDQPFQPVWHEDLAWAVAECLERGDLAGATLRIAGEDVLTVDELIDLFAAVTDRSPVRIPLPAALAKAGSTLAAVFGIETPVSSATVQMLLEGNVIREGEANDLTGRLGFRPEPMRSRLVQLVDELPEQTPDEGVGRLQRRRFRIAIHGAGLDAEALCTDFRENFAEIVAFDAAAEPGAATRLDEGSTLTLDLPARGHVQVRVEDASPESVTLATLEGHPLAGIVRFSFDDMDDTVRFTINVVERPASRIDQVAMALGGSAAQKRTWIATAEAVCKRTGGHAPDGVAEESWSLGDDEAEPLEDWAVELVRRRERRDNLGRDGAPETRRGDPA